MSCRIVGVFDVGKSNAKFAVVDLDAHTELEVRKMPNTVRTDGPYPHYDIPALWDFLTSAIRDLNRAHPLEALSVTTHGAAAALIDEAGELTLPVLDYEFAGPDSLAAAYDAVRPDFAESFTPRLPGGLNLGAQIFWQARTYPEAFARTRWIVPYPQYWSHRLTGAVASEITSLGCHTDLWNFETDIYSSLVRREGWLDRMPEVRPASEVLGTVHYQLADQLGLRHGVPVFSGIHDSNASLLPHLVSRKPPFSVVSTGTWVICCTPDGGMAGLDPARDSLANLDVFGRPVPSARFMGGRVFEILTQPRTPDPEAVTRVLHDNAMLLPSVVLGSGPYPDRIREWTVPKEQLSPDEVFVVASFYLAMMTAVCLELTGADGPSVIEGPFASNALFLEMLASATGRKVEAMAGTATGTSIGAAMLCRMLNPPDLPLPREVVTGTERCAVYARRWHKLLGE